MANAFSDPRFHSEEAAFAALEAIMWPGGKPDACPHCGSFDQAKMNRLAVQRSKPSKKHPDGKPVYGVWKCYACRTKFTVRKGTIFEDSPLPLHQWFQAAFLMCSSKKGVSANQLHRTLGCTLKTAWFVGHRLREAMREGDLAVPFGSDGGAVEADEAFWGRKKGMPKRAAHHHKMKVLTLIDRNTRQAKSTVVKDLTNESLYPVIRKNIAREARLMTDEARHYRRIGREFADHQFVTHGMEEYVRGEAHTNTAEGFFSVFKRGMRGVYQHCQEKHLHRYLAEFDFRYNARVGLGVDDHARMAKALAGAKGKRLRYRDSFGAKG